jgi:glycosyltransferase involved in cell wall biosynthesis
MGLDDAVEFMGYVKDHREAERLLAECAFAVALFNPDLDDFSYYADPGKIKTFLAAGLPVIMTNVPWVAQEIDARRCGFVIPYDEASVTEAMLALLQDTGLLREYRANATAMARDHDYALIFSRALKGILPDWNLESEGASSDNAMWIACKPGAAAEVLTVKRLSGSNTEKMC